MNDQREFPPVTLERTKELFPDVNVEAVVSELVKILRDLKEDRTCDIQINNFYMRLETIPAFEGMNPKDGSPIRRPEIKSLQGRLETT